MGMIRGKYKARITKAQMKVCNKYDPPVVISSYGMLENRHNTFHPMEIRTDNTESIKKPILFS